MKITTAAKEQAEDDAKRNHINRFISALCSMTSLMLDSIFYLFQCFNSINFQFVSEQESYKNDYASLYTAKNKRIYHLVCICVFVCLSVCLCYEGKLPAFWQCLIH